MENADIIISSQTIFTGLDKKILSGAVAIKGDKIIYVGDKYGAVDMIGENTNVLDFGNKLLMAAKHDVEVDANDGKEAWQQMLASEVTEGTLKSGENADLIVLNRNIFKMRRDTYQYLKAVLVVENGEIVYQE